MNICKLLLLLTIIIISLTGCEIPDKTDKGNEEVPPAETVTQSKNDQIDMIQVISEDEEFDGKSVIWDGDKAQVIEDKLDSRDILDGRSGPFELVTLKTNLGFDLVCSKTVHNSDLFMTDKYLVVDIADEYTIETPDRFMSIKREGVNSYDQHAAELSSDKGLIEPGSDVIESETEHKLFTGIIKTTSGKDMIGFILLIPGEESVYSFRYAGLGNYSDIRVEACNTIIRLLNQF